MFAKGSEQMVWEKQLLSDGGCINPVKFLKGKAKKYSGRYETSFRNLLDRMKGSGYIVTRIPGPRGGEYSATYFAHKNQ